MSLWNLCEGTKHIRSISVNPWRVVEAQHLLSSRDLVDTTQEHDILEQLLEESKPPITKEKNYLIFTPFRYPPLNYGSRFGRTYEPSIWYGSLDIQTAFAEVAYYQLLFQKNTSAELNYIETSLTAFNTSINTSKGIDLTEYPFNQYTQKISEKTNYQYSQELGSSMREAAVEAFIFFSARAKNKSKNVAAFTAEVFSKKNNQYIHCQQVWKCIANKQAVEFTRIGISGKKRFCFNTQLLF